MVSRKKDEEIAKVMWIGELLKMTGLPMSFLGKRMGYDPSYLRCIFNGDRKLTAKFLHVLRLEIKQYVREASTAWNEILKLLAEVEEDASDEPLP